MSIYEGTEAVYVTGRTYSKYFHITAAANVGEVLIATVFSQPCRILDINISANDAITADLTSISVYAGEAKVREWVDTVLGLRASIDVEDEEIAFHGSSVLKPTKTIVMILAGDADGPVDFDVWIRYSPERQGGYLA